MKLLLTLSFLILSSFVFAGNEKGNGGNFVHCPLKQSYTLLDFYENSVTPTDSKFLDEWELVDSKIKSLEFVSPLRSKMYQEILKSLKSHLYFVDDSNFSSSEDVGPIFLPIGCELVQVATQVNDYLTGQTLFYVNRKVWNQLSSIERAGLITHEIILTEAVESGHTTSKRARFLNALIWSDKFHEYSNIEFKNLLNTKLSFRYADHSHYWVEMFDGLGNKKNNQWWNEEQLMFGFSKPGARYCQKLTCWTASHLADGSPDMRFDSAGNWLAANSLSGETQILGSKVKIKGFLRFYDNNDLLEVNLAEKFIWQRFSENFLIHSKIILFPSGQVSGLYFTDVISIAISPDSKKVQFGSDGKVNLITFYENGNVHLGVLAADVELLNVNGYLVKKEKGSRVEFEKSGLLKSLYKN